MVLSKGKKIILILLVILVAVIAVIAGFFAIKEKQHRNYQYETLAEIFLGTDPSDDNERNLMLEGKGAYGPVYEGIKHESSFEKALSNKISEIIENPSEVLWRADQQFNVIIDAISTLEQEEIYSESIRSSIQEYLIRTKEELFTQFLEEQTFAGILRLEELHDIIKEDISAYYLSDALTENDLIAFYKEGVRNSIEKKNYSDLSSYLSLIFYGDYVDQTISDLDDLIDTLMEHCSIYTVQQGNGGFYDGNINTSSVDSASLGAAGMESIGSETTRENISYFGDFKYTQSTISSHVDGLLDEASKDKYNSSSSSETLEVQGNSWGISGKYIAYAAEHGAEYIFCTGDPAPDSNDPLTGILLIGPKQLYVFGSNFDCYAVDGNFSEKCAEVARLYNSQHSTYTYSTTDLPEQVDNSETQYGSPDDAMQAAVSAIAQGEYEVAAETYKSFSDNGTNLALICQFAEELKENEVLEDGLDIIYGCVNLSEEGVIQLEVFISQLYD